MKVIQHLWSSLATTVLLAVFFVSCNQESVDSVATLELGSSYESMLESTLDLMETDPQSAVDELEAIILRAESDGLRYYVGKAQWYQAYVYDELLQDVSKAYHYYNEALKNVLVTDDSSLKMKIYNNLGILYRYYSQYDAAIDNYESALQLKEDLSEKELSDLYYNYGVALKLKGDQVSFEKAEKAFTTSLEYAQEVSYLENIASVNHQVGLMYTKIENYDMARVAYQNIIRKYVAEPDLKEFVGKAYHGIGVTYMHQGNNDAAVRAFEKALEYKSSSGSIFITKYDLGTSLLRSKNTDRAIETWKEALQEKHDKNSIEQVKIYSDLTSALSADGRFEEALGFSQIYNSNVQDILKQGELYKANSDKILFAKVINEYDEFNKPVPLLSRPEIIVSLIVGLVAFIYVVLLIYYKSRSRKKVSEVVSKIQTEFMDIRVD